MILGDAGLTLLLHALAVGWLVAQRGRGEATEADEAEPEARSAAYNAPSRRVERWVVEQAPRFAEIAEIAEIL